MKIIIQQCKEDLYLRLFNKLTKHLQISIFNTLQMKFKSAFFLVILLIVFTKSKCLGQSADSTSNISSFSGTIGITNNGFSIVPTFSLNSPAVIANLYFQKKRFSFDPDIRLVPDASKGGLLFWLRYKLVDTKKFTFRVGTHPAFSLIRKEVNINGAQTEITEMLRFVAFEAVPNFHITPNWSVGAVYLNGNGLQNHGPQTTHVLFLNTSISNIKIGGNFRFQFIPTVYFLNVDGSTGNYFTATGIITKQHFPFSLQGTINQTFKSNIAGNRDFMWNVMAAYRFNKTYKRLK